MVLENVKNFLSLKKSDLSNEALTPSFKTLLEMKREVLRLKDFSFKNTTLLSGDAKSSFKGRGIEFEEIRTYQFGDDLRDIDWRVTARKNTPFTKLYIEEKDRKVYIFLDLSDKMYFGTNKELKSVTAAKIAALLGFYALSYKDRIGFAIYTGTQTYIFEPRRQSAYFLSILKKIEQICKKNLFQSPKPSQSLTQALRLFEKKVGSNAVLFIIGSFDANDEQLNRELKTLMALREVYLVDVFDRLEAVCPPKGEYTAEYNGLHTTIKNFSETFEKDYAAYFAAKRKKLRDLCLKHNARYRPVQTDLPLAKQISPV